MSLKVIADHTIHPGFVDGNSVIVDLGANRGDFSGAMIERFGCRCIAVEPSPILFGEMRSHRLLDKHNIAITTSNGPVEFHLSTVPVASSLAHRPPGTFATVTVTGRTLEAFCAELALPALDLLKVDIEGVEIAVLDSCSDEFLRSIGQITVEFHDHVNLVSKADVERLIRRFRSLGFRHFSRYLGCYYDTLFLNQARCPISSAEYFWNRHVLRNWHGVLRRLRRYTVLAPS